MASRISIVHENLKKISGCLREVCLSVRRIFDIQYPAIFKHLHFSTFVICYVKFISLFLTRLFDVVRVAHPLYSFFLCCPIIGLYVLSSVM